MQVISIAARKGGVGKSTLATHLSVLAGQEGGDVLLLDTDPQSSLSVWHGLRTNELPKLIRCQGRELAGIIDQAREAGFKYVFIDTPPFAENTIKDAMRSADVIVTPTRPGLFDLAAVQVTLEMADSLRKEPIAVINHGPPPKSVPALDPSIVAEARETLAGMGAKVARTAIAQRVDLSHALLTGTTVCEYKPRGKANAEIKGLWGEIKSRLEH